MIYILFFPSTGDNFVEEYDDNDFNFQPSDGYKLVTSLKETKTTYNTYMIVRGTPQKLRLEDIWSKRVRDWKFRLMCPK